MFEQKKTDMNGLVYGKKKKNRFEINKIHLFILINQAIKAPTLKVIITNIMLATTILMIITMNIIDHASVFWVNK